MSNALKACLATAALGTALAATTASAAVATYYIDGNAPSMCQAFTPGPTNTVRNRVSGSENIGALMNVACAFENMGSASGGYTESARVSLYNNSASAFSVNCSALSGYFGAVVGTVLNKTSDPMDPGAGTTVNFSEADTPDGADTDLGSYSVGIVCGLPTGGVITSTEASWTDENGVGS